VTQQNPQLPVDKEMQVFFICMAVTASLLIVCVTIYNVVAVIYGQ
jgi:hypothetical protein